MRSMMNKFSAWQEEFGACLDVFSLLEEPMVRLCLLLHPLTIANVILQEAIELLLSSLPSTIPNSYLAHGNMLIERLVRLWSERRAIAAQAVGLAPGSRELQQLVGRLVDQRKCQGPILRSFTVRVLAGC